MVEQIQIEVYLPVLQAAMDGKSCIHDGEAKHRVLGWENFGRQKTRSEWKEVSPEGEVLDGQNWQACVACG